jgi:hypothetical protein
MGGLKDLIGQAIVLPTGIIQLSTRQPHQGFLADAKLNLHNCPGIRWRTSGATRQRATRRRTSGLASRPALACPALSADALFRLLLVVARNRQHSQGLPTHFER